MFRIWELAHGKPPTVVSRVESDVASMARWRDHVARRGARTPWRWSRRSAPALGHHIHPHAGLLAYKGMANLNWQKHVEASDRGAYARAVGLEVVSDDGKVLYWRTTRRGHFSIVSLTCVEAAVVALAQNFKEHSESTWTTGRVPYSTRCSRAGRVCQDKNMGGDELREEAIRKYEDAEAARRSTATASGGSTRRSRTGRASGSASRLASRAGLCGSRSRATLHVATCECEDDAGLMADFARVADASTDDQGQGRGRARTSCLLRRRSCFGASCV